jgi:PQQ-dependent dehydrogenase (methanol/ethanol family)
MATRVLTLVMASVLVAIAAAAPQQEPRTNPRAGNADAIDEGRTLFRSECSYCHGINARGGGRGPDLTSGRSVHGDSDAAIFDIINEGIPGTEMPGNDLETDETWAIVSYLRSLRAPSTAAPAGNARAGEELFFGSATCSQCHMVNGRGGRVGPDLSRIGAARTPASIAENIRTPSKDLLTGYETVSAVARNGTRIVGVRRNEDTFTVQLMDIGQRVHLLTKDDLQEITYPPRSLMPDFPEDRLSANQLQDLIAYLDGLRGGTRTGPPSSSPGAVPATRLLKAAEEPAQWLMYSGDYAGRRFSALNQIGAANVRQLGVQWTFQSGRPGMLETTPLVIDGVMYVTGANSEMWALDARSGRVIWRYRHRLPKRIPLCCGPENHGVAALGDKIYLATLDAHLVALDAKSGAVLWDVVADDYRKGYSFSVAPLAVKDKIIVGVAGGEYGMRGFIDAYEAETGKRAWRFYTIPAPGEPGNDTWSGDSWKRGGAPAWLTGTYDPALNLTYWGIGNPGPDLHGEDRKGDNLYSDSVVALDVDTGRLRWHFQFTPHDVHDWDATQIPMLIDAKVNGEQRKLMVMANRNGFFYALDRSNGKFLFAKTFAKVTWAKGVDANGRPIVLPGTDPTPDGNNVCPGVQGATNWMSPSHSPQTGLFYVTAREQCDTYYSAPQMYREGRLFFGSTNHAVPGQNAWGALRALDPTTGEMKWEFKMFRPSSAGTLATAGGVVFTGDRDGYIMAVDAASGKLLWKINVGGRVNATPITYSLDGRQYVAIAAGSAIFSFGLPGEARRETSPQ